MGRQVEFSGRTEPPGASGIFLRWRERGLHPAPSPQKKVLEETRESLSLLAGGAQSGNQACIRLRFARIRNLSSAERRLAFPLLPAVGAGAFPSSCALPCLAVAKIDWLCTIRLRKRRCQGSGTSIEYPSHPHGTRGLVRGAVRLDGRIGGQF
uniref:Uncharacterized protein n=1 Tax=Tetraselmis sp. GSL018 TaxID=582737 RepID=A0A061RHH2_9CHLO